MSPANVRGDPRGENYSSRGRGWGAKTRRGIPRCHPYTGSMREIGCRIGGVRSNNPQDGTVRDDISPSDTNPSIRCVCNSILERIELN
jgi:hypothetical protein